MNRRFKLRSSTVHERFGDETVILNLESGSYYSAQGTSSFIWNLVSEDCSEAEILQRVRAEFAGDDEKIARGTASYLDQLVEEQLVDSQPANGGGGIHANGAGVQDKVFAEPLLQKYTDMEEMLLLDPIHEVDQAGWPTARQAPA